MSGPIEWSEIRAWCIVYGIEAVITVLSNAIVALTILNNRFLHKRFYYLLLSLSIADLLVGAVACPMFIYVLWGYFSPENKGHGVSDEVSRAQTVIEIFTSYASIYSLVVIACERFVAVIFPRVQQQESKISYISAILVSWLCALLTALLWLTKLIKDNSHYNRAFFVIMFLLSLSLVIVLVCYTAITVKICRKNGTSSSNTQKEHHIALTLLIASALFVVLWLPFQVANYIFHFDKKATVSHHFVYATKFLHYFNSIINPFIYALMLNEFRKGFKNLFCCTEEIQEPKHSGKARSIGGPIRNQGYQNDDVSMTHISRY